MKATVSLLSMQIDGIAYCKNSGLILWSHDEMVVSSCFIFSFSGLASASMMQSDDRVKEKYASPCPSTQF